MKNFDNTFDNKRGNDFRKRDFKRGDHGKGQFGGRDRERSQMHEAICSDCGKKCEVPFRPTGDKPVYCNQCFSSHREGSTFDRSERRGYEKPGFQDRRMFDATCSKCGKRFELPFRPTGEKPVYCNDCFGRIGSSLSKGDEKPVNQYKEQFETLNNKLDRIIRVLIPVVQVKEEKKEVVVGKKEAAVIEKKEVMIEKKQKTKKSNKLADKKKKAKK